MTKTFRGGAAAIAMLCATRLFAAAPAAAEDRPIVAAQPDAGPVLAPYFVDPADDPPLSNDEMAALARQKIKYVFVIFNENHSFDNEFGAFPGVDGLYSDGVAPRSPDQTPGFTQTYTDINGALVAVQPFLIGPQQNASFVDSVDHSHKGLAAKLDVVDGVPRMDGFAADEYRKYAKRGNNMAQAQGLQFARLVMSHIDCDTIPLFWNFANRFTIFDKIFATEDTPSTPNAIRQRSSLVSRSFGSQSAQSVACAIWSRVRPGLAASSSAAAMPCPALASASRPPASSCQTISTFAG